MLRRHHADARVIAPGKLDAVPGGIVDAGPRMPGDADARRDVGTRIALRMHDLRNVPGDVEAAGLHHLVHRRVRHDHRIELGRFLGHQRRQQRLRFEPERHRQHAAAAENIGGNRGRTARDIGEQKRLVAGLLHRAHHGNQLVARIDRARDGAQGSVALERFDQVAKRSQGRHGDPVRFTPL